MAGCVERVLSFGPDDAGIGSGEVGDARRERLGYAWLQDLQRENVAPVQGQVLHLVLEDDTRKRRLLSVHPLHRRGHGEGFGHLANAQHEIQRLHSGYIRLEISLCGFEAGSLRLQMITARRHTGEAESPRVVGLGLPFEACAGVHQLDLHAGNKSAARIHHRAVDSSG
jgi:hypothetical protein